MAQIAASIEYETASPPTGLPDDMQALPGASLRFLSIKAIDGFKVQGALWQPTNKPPADTTMIVQVHGSGGNLYSLPLRAIGRALSGQGWNATSRSSRGSRARQDRPSHRPRCVTSRCADLSLSLKPQSNLTKDHQEAVWAFAQKRRPNFTGR
jgi:predicted alpha/beta-fold hydrolase